MPMQEHTITAFADELRDLSQKIATMGGLAERGLQDAVLSLVRKDRDRAQIVIAGDERIDELERQIEELAILMLAKRQPVARDLREIIGAIRISADLERVGDLSKNIAKRTMAIGPTVMPNSVILGLEHMSESALAQLKNVLDAYAQGDVELALDVWSRDDKIDSLYTSLFRELLTYMIEDPRIITSCTHLLFGAKNIERIGDHATNIAETVHYLVTGEVLKDLRPKGDNSATTVLTSLPS